MSRLLHSACLCVIAVVFSCNAIASDIHLSDLPPGAQALGYTKQVIDERPTAVDISPNGHGLFKFYSGEWYAKSVPPLDSYSTEGGVLAIGEGGDLVSVARDFSLGEIPLLPGRGGFYVEFEAKLTNGDQDHWPALWLMPIEHDNKQSDHYEGDPEKYERWMELDVDEGGNGPGITGTVHNWLGAWPHYGGFQNHNNVSHHAIDRTMFHTFGASYDPTQKRVTWWVDGVEEMNSGPPNVPDIAVSQHYYLIMGAQTHGKSAPYTMLIRRIRAFVPSGSPLPAVP